MNRICLNLESSLAARLRSTSAKLEMAGRLIFLICFDSFNIIGGFILIFLLVLRESRDYGNQLPNLISDLILIGFDLIRSNLIRRFDWSKVDHSRPIAELPVLNSQRSWRQFLTKSEKRLFGGARSLLRRSCKLAFWRGSEWLQRRSRMILASQARISLWARVMLSASILDLLRSVQK